MFIEGVGKDDVQSYTMARWVSTYHSWLSIWF